MLRDAETFGPIYRKMADEHKCKADTLRKTHPQDAWWEDYSGSGDVNNSRRCEEAAEAIRFVLAALERKDAA